MRQKRPEGSNQYSLKIWDRSRDILLTMPRLQRAEFVNEAIVFYGTTVKINLEVDNEYK